MYLRCIVRLIISIVILLIISETSLAQLNTVYVDAVNGSDLYSGANQTNAPSGSGPKATINAGLKALANNGTMVIAAGTYSGSDGAGGTIDINSVSYPNITSDLTIKLFSSSLSNVEVKLTTGDFRFNIKNGTLKLISNSGLEYLNIAGGDIYLEDGTVFFNNSGILHLGNSFTIFRKAGAFTTAPTFGTNMSVSYTGPVTTGPELPGEISRIFVNADVTLGSCVLVKNYLTVNAKLLSAGQNLVSMDQGSTVQMNSGAAITPFLICNGQYNIIYSGASVTGGEWPSTAQLNSIIIEAPLKMNEDKIADCPVTIHGGDFDLNGKTLTVKKDVTVQSNNFFTASSVSSLVFGGNTNTKLILNELKAPQSNLKIKINKASGNNTVSLEGNSLDFSVNKAILYFANGLLVTGDNYIKLDAPVLGKGQGFDRTEVTGSNFSHIVGTVKKQPVNTGKLETSSDSRIEFPVGGLKNYRPAALIFNPSINSLPTVPNVALSVNHVDSCPYGTVGFPIKNGVEEGVDISGFIGFYWIISTEQVSLDQNSVFDLELCANAYTSFDDINNVRIVRRNGKPEDVANTWELQGTNNGYDNEVNNGNPFILSKGNRKGLSTDGAIFSIGRKGIHSVQPIPNMTLAAGEPVARVYLPPYFADVLLLPRTYKAQNSNPNSASVSISNDTLIVKPVAKGFSAISVTSTDTTGDFWSTTFTVTVVANPDWYICGKVVYDNAAASTLSGVVVTLTGAKIFTATTDANGAYYIPTNNCGTYTVTVASVTAWLSTAVTSSDAMAAAQYLVDPVKYPLTDLKKAAADVNNDGKVNSTDALLIMRRIVKLDSTFAKGDWTFASKSITVSGQAVTGADVKGLAVGDVNGSATFTGSLAKASFVNDGSVKVNPGAAIAVPVKAEVENLSALTIQFTYSKELGQFAGVSSKLSGLLANESNGVVTIAWADLSAKEAFTAKNGEFLTLNFKPTEAFKAGKSFSVDITSAEMVNAEGKVMNAMLKGSTVDAAVSSVFALAQNYPNPFNPSTTISYDLPVNSRVSLVVFNVLGQEVATLVNGVQEAGSYKVQFNAQNLTSGMYIYTLQVTNGDQKFTQTHKMILMK